MRSEDLAERIVQFLSGKNYSPQRVRELAQAMGIGTDEQGDFHAACKALLKSGRVVLGSRNALVPAPPPGTLVGSFRKNPRGFGFVVPESPRVPGDLYVSAEHTGGAITGDTVRARVVRRGKRSGQMLYEGRIVEILRRGQSRFVGTLCRQMGRWVVLPVGNTLHVPILVDDPTAKSARAGDEVVVEIIRYPGDRQPARGVLTKVLGPSGEPDVDTKGIIEQYGLPQVFGEDVLEEARRAAAGFQPRRATRDREDLRDRVVITIDPADARDFDDALSLEDFDDGTVELGVHIADVGAYVRAGSRLDAEARERANSVYLPRTVIPMLPEVLSNGVCSLQERQPRLTKSVFIRYGRDGQVKAERFANSVIRSTKRLTYEQVDAAFGGKTGRMNQKVVALLRDAKQLAERIRARRLRAGMLELKLPEVDLIYDEDGRVVDVKPTDEGFSHKLIEMFMVEANEAVARLLEREGVPSLRRVHAPRPDKGDRTLARLLRALGMEPPRQIDRRVLQAILREVGDRPQAPAVNLCVLRSLDQAEYSPARTGHFALASEHYCHFTSPIRRYPDLTVHRLLESYLDGELARAGSEGTIPSEEDLAELGRHCSDRERRAESAERELRLVFLLRLLEQRIGEEVNGLVTGVANVGCFVQVERYLVDGLLRFADIGDDWWNVDAPRGTVVGERSGKRISIGDTLPVIISRVHVPTRTLDLALARSARLEHDIAAARPSAKTRKTSRGRARQETKGKRRNRDESGPREGRKSGRKNRQKSR